MEPVDTTDPELADMVETASAVIHRVVPMAEITDFFDRSFTELATALARQGIAPAGPAFPVVAADAHAVIDEAKAAGVYVFGGGIDEDVAPVLVSANGSVSDDTYPGIVIRGRLPLRSARDSCSTTISRC